MIVESYTRNMSTQY